MNEQPIFPRSPRESMDGWAYLPRFIDKVRLHLAHKLSADYAENFTQGFDGLWLKAAGLEANVFIEVVKGTITDGEVCDWVRQHVRKTAAEKEAFANYVLNRGRQDDASARLQLRKEQLGLGKRDDIQTYVDLIELDEKRR